jgi:pyruvate formate lyase activating enzyme
MKEALFYKRLNKKEIRCLLCPWKCVIGDGSFGNCGVRKNIGGKLFSLVYGKITSEQIDPIEKKPLFHFFPGASALSIGTIGCNMHCKHCQNWTTSQAKPGTFPDYKIHTESIVEEAVNNDCKIIAYTYNEPTIFFEYALDTAKLAKKQGLKNVMVTNGFINPEPLKELYRYIDAVNVDLKSFNDKFYRKICGVWLEPVLESLKAIKKMGVWTEVTNLVIPTLNDDMEEIKKMCKWVKHNLGKETPMHFSRFFPMYKLEDIPTTPLETLHKAKEIADKYLDYVYIGNVMEDENTYCPKCKSLLIERRGYAVLQNNINDGKCKCGQAIAGVWE